ncbi:MAG: SLC13 family permease [Pseudomonadota bacterium]
MNTRLPFATAASSNPERLRIVSPVLPGPRWLIALVIAISGNAGIWLGLGDADADIRVALCVFLLAIIGWSVLRLPATPVALVAGLSLVVSGVVPAQTFYLSMGHHLIWLLFAAFVIGSALSKTGLAHRFVLAMSSRSGTVRELFFAIGLAIAATAFLVPSTTGRAALLVPVYVALAAAIDDRRINRALALLFPTAVLLSAGASMIGAGAHLVAVDFMAYAGTEISFLYWVVLGAPFAALSLLLATLIILNVFLTSEERARKLIMAQPEKASLSSEQVYVLLVSALTVTFWLTQQWHRIDLAIGALIGAVAITLRPLSGISLKETISDVNWSLLVFLAVTLMLGHALIDTGAASLITSKLLAFASGGKGLTPAAAVMIAAFAAIAAHLVITSRTARVAVLIPSLALPLSAFGINPAALIFLMTMGSGFCQTMYVSAKPVALFAGLDVATYDDRDLLRLSAWLLPGMTGLLLLFSFFVWPVLGLELSPPVNVAAADGGGS